MTIDGPATYFWGVLESRMEQMMITFDEFQELSKVTHPFSKQYETYDASATIRCKSPHVYNVLKYQIEQKRRTIIIVCNIEEAL